MFYKIVFLHRIKHNNLQQKLHRGRGQWGICPTLDIYRLVKISIRRTAGMVAPLIASHSSRTHNRKSLHF